MPNFPGGEKHRNALPQQEPEYQNQDPNLSPEEAKKRAERAGEIRDARKKKQAEEIGVRAVDAWRNIKRVIKQREKKNSEGDGEKENRPLDNKATSAQDRERLLNQGINLAINGQFTTAENLAKSGQLRSDVHRETIQDMASVATENADVIATREHENRLGVGSDSDMQSEGAYVFEKVLVGAEQAEVHAKATEEVRKKYGLDANDPAAGQKLYEADPQKYDEYTRDVVSHQNKHAHEHQQQKIMDEVNSEHYDHLSESDSNNRRGAKDWVIDRAQNLAHQEAEYMRSMGVSPDRVRENYDRMSHLYADAESAMAFLREKGETNELTRAFDSLSVQDQIKISQEARREALKRLHSQDSRAGVGNLQKIDELRTSKAPEDQKKYVAFLESMVNTQLSLADKKQFEDRLHDSAMASIGESSDKAASDLNSEKQGEYSKALQQLRNEWGVAEAKHRRALSNGRRNLLKSYNTAEPAQEKLRVVDIDRTASIEDLARSAARRKLNEELSKYDKNDNSVENPNGDSKTRFRGIKRTVTRLWKGNVMRGYYQRKYERQMREQLAEHNDQMQDKVDVGAMINNPELKGEKKPEVFALIERMMNDHDDYISKSAGESRIEVDKDSDQYKNTVELIRKYATTDEMDSAELREAIDHIRRGGELSGDKKSKNTETYLDNYIAVANYVKESMTHINGLDNVQEQFDAMMSDFKIYEATSAEGARTREHRTKVDKLIDKFEKSKLGQFIPADVVAGAASVAIAATRGATGKAANWATFGGASAVAGVVAGVRQHNKVTTDRAAAMREIAEGRRGLNEKDKYNGKIIETIYHMAPAAELIARANNCTDWIEEVDFDNPDDVSDLRNAGKMLTELISRREISDSQHIDLISYSGASNIEQQRLDLVDAQLRLQARFIEQSLRENPDFNYNEDFLKPLLESIRNKNTGADAKGFDGDTLGELMQDVKKRDEVFKKFRRRQSIKKGLAVGAISLGASSLAYTATQYLSGHMPTVSGEHIEQVAAEQPLGPKVAPIKPIEPTNYPNPEFHRAGWYDNGTTFADGNEITGHFTPNGMVFNPQDAFGNGMSISHDQIMDLAQNGQIKLLVSPTAEMAKQPFEVTGQVVDGQIVFNVDPNSVVGQMINDRSFAYVEIANAQNGMVFSTQQGSGLPNFQQLIDQKNQAYQADLDKFNKATANAGDQAGANGDAATPALQPEPAQAPAPSNGANDIALNTAMGAGAAATLFNRQRNLNMRSKTDLGAELTQQSAIADNINRLYSQGQYGEIVDSYLGSGEEARKYFDDNEIMQWGKMASGAKSTDDLVRIGIDYSNRLKARQEAEAGKYSLEIKSSPEDQFSSAGEYSSMLETALKLVYQRAPAKFDDFMSSFGLDGMYDRPVDVNNNNTPGEPVLRNDVIDKIYANMRVINSDQYGLKKRGANYGDILAYYKDMIEGNL